jgi:hypothetical protein
MELLLRIGGTAVSLLGGFLTGLWEVFLSPPHAFGVVLPVAPVLAVATNAALVWFARLVTGSAGLAALPGVAWFVTMFTATVRTTEGDLLLPGNDWPGLLALLFGGLAWAVAAYRLVAARPR